jgi:NADH dehydrogenase
MTSTPIIGAEPGKVLLKDMDAVWTSTFIWTCGVKGTEFGAGLGLPMGKRNRFETDAGMRSPKYPFAYAVGDNAGLLVEGRPMAMIVESAHFSAEAAAGNIIAEIDGGKRHEFRPNYHGFMVSTGGRFGVANAGGMRTSGFIAMAMKHLINMYYLFRIAGLNQVWEYFKHEFLDMESGRSIVGGFFSYKVRGYWVLLLRLWLGISWLFEGINKIGEGWLAFSSGTKSGWMFSSGIVQAGVVAAADATSAATAAAGTVPASSAAAATAATSAATAVAGAVATGAVAATSAASVAGSGASAAPAPAAFHDIWDLTKPIFMDGLFSYLPYPVFQSTVVVTEIGIGLIFLGGFFTWLGAVASIGLTLVFTLSGMFRWDQAWFLFAAITMMGGAGRAFGLDYWSVPLFKKRWNGTRFARRSHLYGDDPTK